MSLASRLAYYARSVPVLLRGVEEAPSTLASLALGRAPARPIRLRPDGLRLHVRSLMDVWIVKETCLDRVYDRIAPAPGAARIVLDIGAGIGDFAVHAARLWPAATIHAYEPFAESFRLLVENLRLNGLSNVRAHEQAVSARAGTVAMERGRTTAGHRIREAGVPGRGEAVPATTLAQILEEHAIPRCDFLKMDVEGAEFEVLPGLDDKAWSRVEALSVEVHEAPGRSRDALADCVRIRGFDVTFRPSPAHRRLSLLDARRVVIA